MQTVEKIVTLPLELNPSGIGSHEPKVVVTEWTPSPTSTVPIKSTWREAIGTKLTNGRIRKHQLAGWYGPMVRERALKTARPTHGYIFRCECGVAEELRYLTWTYLPKPGYYCPRCIASYRRSRDREKQMDKELTARIRAAYI